MVTDRQTDTQTKYCNPRCACTPRVNFFHPQCSFPYTPKGVKTSKTPGQDQTERFLKDKLKLLLGDGVDERTQLWKDIGEIIISLQPKIEVDSSGKVVDVDGVVPKISPGDEESCALLHYYRNCTIHRCLIPIPSEDVCVEIDQTTRGIEIARKQQDREGYFCRELGRSYLIKLPKHITVQTEKERCLLDVLTQLKTFVTRTCNKLLSAANLPERSFNEHSAQPCPPEPGKWGILYL